MKLKELAMTDLRYRLAKKNSDGSITHFSFPVDFTFSSEKGEFQKRVKEAIAKKEKFDGDIEIQDGSTPALPFATLSSKEVTTSLSSEAQSYLNKKIQTTLRQYNDELPCEPGVFNKLERICKKVLIKVLPNKLISDKLRKSVYLRKVSQAIYLGVKFSEEDQDKAYDMLSNVIESLGTEIKSYLGVYQLPLADVVGDGKTRFALYTIVHVNSKLSELYYHAMSINPGNIKRELLAFQEGGEPYNISKLPEIKEVEL